MKKIMSILTLAVALFLTACSQQEKATQTSSSARRLASSADSGVDRVKKPESKGCP